MSGKLLQLLRRVLREALASVGSGVQVPVGECA
jgi:hypothetical protein